MHSWGRGGGDVRNNNLTNVAILVQLRGDVGITREYKKRNCGIPVCHVLMYVQYLVDLSVVLYAARGAFLRALPEF